MPARHSTAQLGAISRVAFWGGIACRSLTRRRRSVRSLRSPAPSHRSPRSPAPSHRSPRPAPSRPWPRSPAPSHRSPRSPAPSHRSAQSDLLVRFADSGRADLVAALDRGQAQVPAPVRVQTLHSVLARRWCPAPRVRWGCRRCSPEPTLETPAQELSAAASAPPAPAQARQGSAAVLTQAPGPRSVRGGLARGHQRVRESAATDNDADDSSYGKNRRRRLEPPRARSGLTLRG